MRHMPRTSSAKKALRQNVRRRAKNLARRARMRTDLKAYRKLAAARDGAQARAALAKAYQTFDKLAKTGFIKKGKARRLKSRLAKKLPRA